MVKNAEFYYRKGIGSLEKYKYALRNFNKSIEMDSNYEWAYLGRGILHREWGEYDQAFSDFDKAIEINSNNGEVYYERGCTKHNRYNFLGAITDFNTAFEIVSPNDSYYPELCRQRAETKIFLDDEEGAENDRKLYRQYLQQQNDTSKMKKVYVVASYNGYDDKFADSIDGIFDNVNSAVETAETLWKGYNNENEPSINKYYSATVYEFNLNTLSDWDKIRIWKKEIGIEKQLDRLDEMQIDNLLDHLNNIIDSATSSYAPKCYKDRSIIKKYLGDIEGAAKDMEIYKQQVKQEKNILK